MDGNLNSFYEGEGNATFSSRVNHFLCQSEEDAAMNQVSNVEQKRRSADDGNGSW